MCVILAKQSDTRIISKKEFTLCESTNPHGMGLAYPDGDEVQIWRTLDDLDGLYELYREVEEMDVPMLIHFRIATVGEVNFDNLQPLQAQDHIALAHNGTLNIHNVGENKSDTREFRDRILDPLPEDWWENEAIATLIGSYIGRRNLVAFLNARKNQLAIYNKSMGSEVNGIWYSNLNHIPRGWGHRFRQGESLENIEEDYINFASKDDDGSNENGNSNKIEDDDLDEYEICDECFAAGGHFSDSCPNVDNNQEDNETIDEKYIEIDEGKLILGEDKRVCWKGVKFNGDRYCIGCLESMAGKSIEEIGHSKLFMDEPDLYCKICGRYLSNNDPQNIKEKEKYEESRS